MKSISVVDATVAITVPIRIRFIKAGGGDCFINDNQRSAL
jgi:hypothetical protein